MMNVILWQTTSASLEIQRERDRERSLQDMRNKNSVGYAFINFRDRAVGVLT